MRKNTIILQLALTVLLVACDRQNSATDIDPVLGLECFESHRAQLPPGTQYEGIKGQAGNRLTIKIMSGVEVETIECALNPEGALLHTDK